MARVHRSGRARASLLLSTVVTMTAYLLIGGALPASAGTAGCAYDAGSSTLSVTLAAGDTDATLGLDGTDILVEGVSEGGGTTCAGPFALSGITTLNVDVAAPGSREWIKFEDALNLNWPASINVDLGDHDEDVLDLEGLSSSDTFSGLAPVDTVTGVEELQVYGHEGNDIFNYSAYSATELLTIYGEAGADNITGSPGDDYLDGGAGNDTIKGGAGDDRLLGGLFDDVLEGGPGADTIIGGDGSDTASYRGSAKRVQVDLYLDVQGTLLNGDAAGDVFQALDVENLIGSSKNDILKGNATANTIYGLSGDDTLWGLEGADALFGGSGADNHYGGTESDFCEGFISSLSKGIKSFGKDTYTDCE